MHQFRRCLCHSGRWSGTRYRRGKSTIAAGEGDKFSRLDWRDEGGVMMRVLRSMNTLRVPLVYNSLLGLPPQATPTYHAPKPLEGFSVLDVGCGAGFLSEPVAQLGAKVTGLEPSREVLDVARRRLNLDPELASRVEYRCQTLEEMREGEEEGFDCVVASEVAEHVDNLPLFHQLLSSSVKPGGHIILTTINKTFQSFLTVIAGAEYILPLLPRGTHNWSQFITPEELTTGLERREGVMVDWIGGMWFNPFTSQWAWSDSTSVNYTLRAVRTL